MDFFTRLAEANAKLTVLENTVLGADALRKSAEAQAVELVDDLSKLANGVFTHTLLALAELETRFANLESRDALAKAEGAR